MNGAKMCIRDSLYDTEEDAYEYGCYLKSCYFQGQEILHMSNPGDNPEPDYDEEMCIRDSPLR